MHSCCCTQWECLCWWCLLFFIKVGGCELVPILWSLYWISTAIHFLRICWCADGTPLSIAMRTSLSIATCTSLSSIAPRPFAIQPRMEAGQTGSQKNQHFECLGILTYLHLLSVYFCCLRPMVCNVSSPLCSLSVVFVLYGLGEGLIPLIWGHLWSTTAAKPLAPFHSWGLNDFASGSCCSCGKSQDLQMREQEVGELHVGQVDLCRRWACHKSLLC